MQKNSKKTELDFESWSDHELIDKDEQQNHEKFFKKKLKLLNPKLWFILEKLDSTSVDFIGKLKENG